ncbi:bifunctional NAD(P)H-dependent oxidoreductase/GNAT family N-acetyltransferase [Allokutzneria multivorans]|uniref:bifunctional NAD(P)H-dependent oxidoreductase/GNAT family N-acetyltransferase n=1 Tax=Allokutzneria multivorans TaxID=1142134 RepID=UPI0031E70008
MSTKLLVLVASTRPGRIGPAIAEWFVRAIASEPVTVDVADLAEIGLPLLDEPGHPSSGEYVHEHTRAWSRRVDAADAVVVITPEYNSGMPATLKNAFDVLYREWAWKPIGFVGYGNTSAGTRAVQMAKQVATSLRMVPVGATVALRLAESTRDGQVIPSADRDAAARGVLREVAKVARVTRPLRSRETPGPVDGVVLTVAESEDLPELLVLQRCCWVQEALANETLDLAPLRESLVELRASGSTWQQWCVRRDGRLIAAARARRAGTAWEIGRLMVAPDQAGQGIGSWLLAHVEAQAPEGTTHHRLHTGRRSTRNIELYERAGYTVAPADEMSVSLTRPRDSAPTQSRPGR